MARIDASADAEMGLATSSGGGTARSPPRLPRGAAKAEVAAATSTKKTSKRETTSVTMQADSTTGGTKKSGKWNFPNFKFSEAGPQVIVESTGTQDATFRLNDGLSKAFKTCNATQDQVLFFNSFRATVLKVWEGDQQPEATQEYSIVLSADLRSLEVSLSFHELASFRQALIEFMNELELSTSHMTKALTALDKVSILAKDSNKLSLPQIPTALGLCCRLGGMGTASPAIDCLYRVEHKTGEHGSFEWHGLDVLLPPSEDKDLLLDFAMNERPVILPIAVFGSLLPNEPEIGIEMAPHCSCLHATGLMFFKTLNLAMPPDAALDAVFKTRAWSGTASASFGEGGIRQVRVRFEHAECKHQVDSLAKALALDFRSKDFITCCKHLKVDAPNILDIVAEASGYNVNVGFLFNAYT